MTPERESRLRGVIARRQTNLGIVLENVFDPHNISAVMRTCDSVGVQDIYILTTRLPPHKKWGPRSSSSAAKWMTVHQFHDTEECLAALRSRYDQIFTTHLGNQATSLYQMDLTGSLALVFGNEHGGITEALRSNSDGNFVIPQEGIIQSLNISVACAVTLYEAYRQRALKGYYQHTDLNDPRKKQLLQEWDLNSDTRYYPPVPNGTFGRGR